MALPLTKKSDAAAPTAPPWHPNLRIVEQLPDTKVVRTAFFVNGIAMLVAVALALYLGIQEWKLHEVNKQIADWQHQIDQNKRESAAAVALYANFKADSAKTAEVANFVSSSPVASEIIMRLGQITSKRIAFDSLDIKSGGISIRATVKGAADHATGDASQYERQLRTDKVLGPMFKDVNLLTMRRNQGNGRLVIEIYCEFLKGKKA